MSRAARLDLRSFQKELANRLASKTAAQVESSRLGIACGERRWLIRLGEAGEVIAVPPVVTVPLTKPWFLGLANIRGNLYSVIDFPAFQGEGKVAGGSLARLILLSSRGGESVGIVVERVLGLRNQVAAIRSERWMRPGTYSRPAAPMPQASPRFAPFLVVQRGPFGPSITCGIRSRHSADAFVTNRSGGSQQRSMWQSAEIIS